jgi:dihydroorotate dehydrogenase (fumarate)
MTDLSTTYLGLRLRTPIVASAGPLTGQLQSLSRLEAAGASAVVLPSLFEERVTHDAYQINEYFETGAFSQPEATNYAPVLDVETAGEAYLELVEKAKAALGIPVIASLNGVTAGGWTDYARQIEQAGADALELNLYRIAADVDVPGEQVEAELCALVAAVRSSIRIPLAVKVGPFFTSFAHVASRLVEAGADGLVLFNRFYQPDIDIDTLEVRPRLVLSVSEELRLPLRWIAILYGRVQASLAATSGVHSAPDVAKALLAGADVAMMTSALLQHGPDHIETVERELAQWTAAYEYDSVDQLKGSVSQRNVADPSAFERANYLQILELYSSSFRYDPSFPTAPTY